MALCESCMTWFAGALQQIYLNQIGKNLTEVQKSDLTDWEDTIEASDRPRKVTELCNILIAWDRDNLNVNPTGCWLCYRLSSLPFDFFTNEKGQQEAQIEFIVYVQWKGEKKFSYNLRIAPSGYHPFSAFAFKLAFPLDDVEFSDFEDDELQSSGSDYNYSSSIVTRSEYAFTSSEEAGKTARLKLLSDRATSQETESTVTQEQLYQLRFVEMRRLLYECRNSHLSCAVHHGRTQDEGCLPTRLVHIGPGGRSAKIVETRDLSSFQPLSYATLSYCWGESPFKTLTTDNIKSFRQAVPIEQLGLTIRQAFHVASSLSIDYIWIDCLCIIQDSLQDWNTEAANMHHIYQGSTLNIAVASSAKVSDGFLIPALAEQPNARVSFQLPNGLHLLEWSLNPWWVCNLSFGKLPLGYRGWVLQECFLSPRNLYWTQGQTVWQCNQTIQPELSTRSTTLSKRLDLPFRFQIPIATIENVAALDRVWYVEVVPQFSPTEVTFERDRFFALAGLLASFCGRYAQLGITTRYIAGLWEHDILARIDWQHFGVDSALTHHTKDYNPRFYVPSWSWLNVRCSKVFYHSFLFERHHMEANVIPTALEAKEIFIEYEHPEQPFGPIKSAYIYMRAKVFEIRVMRRRDSLDDWSIGCLDVSYILPRLVRRNRSDPDLDIWAELPDQMSLHKHMACMMLDPNVVLPLHIPTVCLPVRWCNWEGGFALRAVMLMLCGEKNGIFCYQRIGCLELYIDSAESHNFDQVREFFKEDNLENREFYFL